MGALVNASAVEGFLKDERLRDKQLCGDSLEGSALSQFADEGAHAPTASHYFVLEDLFGRLGLSDRSHVLDVGCGAGRALLFHSHHGYPGRMDGVELDPELAARARRATRGFCQVNVMQASVLDIPLQGYTHFYLFNPFDSWVLERFVEKLEADVSAAKAGVEWGDREADDCEADESDKCETGKYETGGCPSDERETDGSEKIILCHMSDNGEGYLFMGRSGWRLAEEGTFQDCEGVRVFDYPQHWSIWEYDTRCQGR